MKMTETYPDSTNTPEGFLDKMRQADRPNLTHRIVEEASGGPIATFKINDPQLPFQWQIMHRPHSVLIIPSITTSVSDEVWTIVAGEVFHYGCMEEKPNFAAGGIDPGESIEKAALREACKEELPVLKPEYVTHVTSLGGGFASVGGSTEIIYPVHLEARLPDGMSHEDLDGHIGGLFDEGERIRSTVHELTPAVEDIVCGIADKYATNKVLRILAERVQAALN